MRHRRLTLDYELPRLSREGSRSCYSSSQTRSAARALGAVEQVAQRSGERIHRVGLLEVVGSIDFLQVAAAVVVSRGVENLEVWPDGGESVGEFDPAHFRHHDV